MRAGACAPDGYSELIEQAERTPGDAAMQEIRSILVYLEAIAEDDLALHRAQLIASKTGARLQLLICDQQADHSHAMAELVRCMRDAGYTAEGEQAWQDSVEKTILFELALYGCELLIKQHVPDSGVAKALLTPLDWKLLRHCPCAVLMVKTRRRWAQGAVLAAVDVANPDGEHRSLHYSIVAHAHDIAALAKGQLHVVSAYPSPIMATAEPVLHTEGGIDERYRQQCQAFRATYGIDQFDLHITEGPPDESITQTARELDAVVTVIGTVARSGLSGALIGNTAETVLDALESDVLVLKPQDIIDQLQALAAG